VKIGTKSENQSVEWHQKLCKLETLFQKSKIVKNFLSELYFITLVFSYIKTQATEYILYLSSIIILYKLLFFL